MNDMEAKYPIMPNGTPGREWENVYIQVKLRKIIIITGICIPLITSTKAERKNSLLAMSFQSGFLTPDESEKLSKI